jgi:hypothetical protein
MTIPRQSTLLDLVQAITIFAANEAETVATAAYLINSGRVRLCGTFAGARIDFATPAHGRRDHFSSKTWSTELITATIVIASVGGNLSAARLATEFLATRRLISMQKLT